MPPTPAPHHPHRPVSHPAIDPPTAGRSVEVAPGLRWVRLPLPYSVDHIDIWLVEDAQGWTLFDTGACTPAVVQAWEAMLERELKGLRLARICVTHWHPDHIGMAGWLHRRFGAPLHMSELEYRQGLRVVDNTIDRAEIRRHYAAAGWSAAALDHVQHQEGWERAHISPLPAPFQRLRPGDEWPDDAGHWEVLVGRGHTSEHLCYHHPGRKLLVTGDQILSRISSNISVLPDEIDADPLAAWFDSMRAIRERVAEDVLVLAAHDGCFHGLHTRVAYLEASQHRALDRLRSAMDAPRRVVDVFGQLFKGAIDENDYSQSTLATGQALACLNHLIHRGEIVRHVDDQGVWWHERTARTTAARNPARAVRPMVSPDARDNGCPLA